MIIYTILVLENVAGVLAFLWPLNETEAAPWELGTWIPVLLSFNQSLVIGELFTL